MNRITSILLVLVMVFMLFPSSADAIQIADEYENEFERNIQLLSAIGIIDENFAESGETITRQDAIYYSLVMKGYKDTVTTIAKDDAGIFADVDRNSEYFPYIMMAAELGIVAYDSEFRPEDDVTLAELIKIFSSVIGYVSSGENSGGYPAEYVVFAKRAGILSGADLTDVDMHNPVTYYAFSKLMLNTLLARTFNMKFIVAEGFDITVAYEEYAGTPLLTEVFDITEVSGLVTANKYTNLSGGSGTRQDSVVINKVEYLLEDASRANAIGLGVNAFVKYNEKTDDMPKIIFLEQDNSQRVLVECDKIQPTTTLSSFEYYNDKNKLVREPLGKSVTLIYNNKVSALDDADKIMPEVGTVELIDNDSDGDVEIIKVKDYERLMIGNIDYENKVIASKLDTSVKKEPLVVDKYALFIVERNGKSVDFEDLKINDVIFYAESEGKTSKVIEIVATDKTINGTVVSVSADEVEIGAAVYRLVDSADKYISLGRDGSFYLDPFDYVYYAAYYNEKVYGYLNSIGYNNLSLDDKVELKIFTENSRWVVLELNDKVKFNGTGTEKAKVYTSLYNSGDFRQLITYMVDEDGNITELNTARTAERWSDTEVDLISSDTFRKYCTLSEAAYRTTFNSFMNVIAIDADTKIFMIPEQTAGETAEEDDFSVVSMGSLSSGMTYKNITGYDHNMSGVVAACICVGNTAVYDKGSELAIVIGKSVMLGEDGETVRGLKCYYNGSKLTLPVMDNVTNYNDLGVGDVIQVGLSQRGMVQHIAVHYDYSVDKKSKKQPANKNAYDAYTMLVGEVKYYDTEQGIINIDYGSEANNQYTMFNASAVINVYTLEEGRDSAPIVREGDLSEIVPGKVAFMRIVNYKIEEIMIIDY